MIDTIHTGIALNSTGSLTADVYRQSDGTLGLIVYSYGRRIGALTPDGTRLDTRTRYLSDGSIRSADNPPLYLGLCIVCWPRTTFQRAPYRGIRVPEVHLYGPSIPDERFEDLADWFRGTTEKPSWLVACEEAHGELSDRFRPYSERGLLIDFDLVDTYRGSPRVTGIITVDGKDPAPFVWIQGKGTEPNPRQYYTRTPRVPTYKERDMVSALAPEYVATFQRAHFVP